MKSFFIILSVSFIISGSAMSQSTFDVLTSGNKKHFLNDYGIGKDFFENSITGKGNVSKPANSTFPIAIGIAAFVYLFNPIILFENDKIALGFTKEASVGFGYFGEHRLSFEYSYIFRKDLNSNIRLGYKYDILLQQGIKPSNLLQAVPTLSFGGGYFHNFSRPGWFAESSIGYSIRNDKLLIYPSVKLRFTHVAQGANIYDLSFGMIIGIANPFIDLNIRNTHDNE
ncbi:MAG: hypothetical protein SGI89_01430 [bacterium]|nr:hypothetical protein [bacterium]